MKEKYIEKRIKEVIKGPCNNMVLGSQQEQVYFQHQAT